LKDIDTLFTIAKKLSMSSATTQANELDYGIFNQLQEDYMSIRATFEKLK
jgi:hypothetical protein